MSPNIGQYTLCYYCTQHYKTEQDNTLQNRIKQNTSSLYQCLCTNSEYESTLHEKTAQNSADAVEVILSQIVSNMSLQSNTKQDKTE